MNEGGQVIRTVIEIQAGDMGILEVSFYNFAGIQQTQLEEISFCAYPLDTD